MPEPVLTMPEAIVNIISTTPVLKQYQFHRVHINKDVILSTNFQDVHWPLLPGASDNGKNKKV